DVLQMVGLPRESTALYPHEFSGGQRQRIAIARALVGTPKFIFLDEPVSALDVSIRAQILNLLKHLQATLGLAYVMISHDLGAARYLATRLAVMYAGKLVETGACDAVYSAPLHPYTEALLSAALPLPSGDVGTLNSSRSSARSLPIVLTVCGPGSKNAAPLATHLSASRSENALTRLESSGGRAMLRPQEGLRLVLAVAGLVMAIVAIAYAAPIGTLKQFRVPTRNSSPLDITQGSDGNFWFTEGNVLPPQPFGPHNVGLITPSGAITEFAVCFFCFPNRIVQGPGGVLYFTKSDPGLGRIRTD